VNPNVFRFRCPLCHDSQKNTKKARGYLFRKGDRFIYRCHNCQAGMTFLSLMRQLDPTLANEFRRDMWRERFVSRTDLSQSDKSTPQTKLVSADDLPAVSTPNSSLVSKYVALVNTLVPEHHILGYIRHRRLPERAYPLLGYTENWGGFLHEQGWASGTLNIQPQQALVLLAFDASWRLLGAQARIVQSGASYRYLTGKSPAAEASIFGLPLLVPHRPVFLTEGPIDSLMFDNGVAAMSAGLDSAAEKATAAGYSPSLTEWIRVYDNEPRNPQIVDAMEQTIRRGAPIVIWPAAYRKYKDVNELVQAESWTPDRVSDTFKTWVYQGLRARVRMGEWQAASGQPRTTRYYTHLHGAQQQTWDDAHPDSIGSHGPSHEHSV
jgi:hypothetical protein